MFLFIIILIIAIIIFTKVKNFIMRKKGREEFDKLKSAYIINKQITVTKTLDFSDKWMINVLLIDEKNEKLVYLKSTYKKVTLIHKIFDFKSLLKCEVFQDNTVYLIEEKGLITDRMNKQEKIKTMGLRLIFNDIAFPMLEIPFITSEVSPTSFSGSSEVDKVHNWAAIFEVIIKRGQTYRVKVTN